MDETTGSARDRMLDAGATIWHDGSTSEVFGGLSVTGVARVAGVTRSTFYAHWPTTEVYLRDLVRHLSDPVWGPAIQDHSRTGAAFRSGGMTLLDRLLTGCHGHMTALLADPAFTLRLGLSARSEDPELADVLRSAHQTSDTEFGRLLFQFDTLWGREPRPPLEEHHLPAILTALADGLALRHRLDPERFPTSIYGPTALALLLTLTRHPEDPRDMPGLLGMVNDWPTLRWGSTARSSPIDTRPLTDGEVRELLLLAQRLNGAEGWLEVSLPRLASLTSTPESQIVRAFGSTAGLAMALFLYTVSERYREVVPTDDALADLRLLIDIRAEELERSTAIASAIVSILSGNSTYARPHTFAFDPRPQLVAGIRRAQEEGPLDPAMDPNEFAGVLESTVLFCVPRLTPRPSPSVDAIDLLLRGASIASVDR